MDELAVPTTKERYRPLHRQTVSVRLLMETVLPCLTHLCRMDFPIHIIWMSPFSVLGALGVFFFIFISFSMNNFSANRIAPDGTPLFCLPMSH